jgi:shikimate kinase
MIRLVGPGGAGKSTAGAALARQLGVPFFDLDRWLEAREGNIDALIAARGYAAYARANVEAYRDFARGTRRGVLALSSGFMTYPRDVHPSYAAVRARVARAAGTFVLLPSLDAETCVAETVRRQLTRPLGRRDAAREEAVARERFALYAALPAPKVETMRPPDLVAADLAARALALGLLEARRATGPASAMRAG